MSKKAVLVTTEFRGVFFGYVKEEGDLPESITLTKARNCLYWSKDCSGFLGLASVGPVGDSRISACVEELKIYKITSVTPISEEAIKVWESK